MAGASVSPLLSHCSSVWGQVATWFLHIVILWGWVYCVCICMCVVRVRVAFLLVSIVWLCVHVKVIFSAMSTSGTLTSYYVDSLILPESEELSVPRYPSANGLQHARQPASISDPSELGTCTFPSKPQVFGPTWNHVPAQFPGTVSSVYHHHYGHPQGPVAAETDGRYQSWLLEPMSASLPLTGLPTSQHFGIKPEGLGTRGEGALPGSHTSLLLSDYANGTVATASPRQKDELSAQADVSAEGEEKPGLDPSKWLHTRLCFNNLRRKLSEVPVGGAHRRRCHSKHAISKKKRRGGGGC